jgi:hypothetical protein
MGYARIGNSARAPGELFSRLLPLRARAANGQQTSEIGSAAGRKLLLQSLASVWTSRRPGNGGRRYRSVTASRANRPCAGRAGPEEGEFGVGERKSRLRFDPRERVAENLVVNMQDGSARRADDVMVPVLGRDLVQRATVELRTPHEPILDERVEGTRS